MITSRFASAAPTGYRFPREVIAVERGIEVDHVTVDRWVQTVTPEFIDASLDAALDRRSLVGR